MSWFTCLLFVVTQSQPTASVTGHVVDAQGQSISEAVVFAETVESEQIASAQAGTDGSFAFSSLPPGLTGVFAHAPGRAFGGFTVRLEPGQALANQNVVLAAPASVSGTVLGYKDKAAQGARILRVALLGGQKVSIPFERLRPYGIQMPTSGEKGRFQVDNLPEGVPVALKFSHSDYPVQAVTGLTAGDRNAKAVLMPGVLVTGNTLIRGGDRAVAHVNLKITNAQPPYESLTARSDGEGRYSVQVKPGAYTFEGVSAAYRSAGMQRVTITGQQPDQRVNLFMLPTGVIVGDVRDAVNNDAVAGAKLILESSGNPAAVAYTDANGRYRFTGASGMNKVYLAETPGSSAGETRSMEVTVPSDGEYEMPVFWVRPTTAFTVKVVDGNGGPVSSAIITLLSPATLGWRYTDAAGNVSIEVGTVPEDGRLAGIAQHPGGSSGAFFVMLANESQEHLVQLLALGSVRGRLVDEQGHGVGGHVVAGRLIDETGRASLVLWQTVSQPDGAFAWQGVPPNVQQQVFCFTGDQASAAGAAFYVEQEATADLGTIRVPGTSSGASAAGSKLDWKSLHRISGVVPPGSGHPAVVFYVPSSEAAATLETLEEAQRVIASYGYQMALVLNGPATPMESTLPVLEGQPPGIATTYVTDAAGNVALETFGLPPLFTLEREGR